MEPELSKILNECIDKINGTSSIEVCLAYHPEIRKELEPLLYTSRAISEADKVKPSEEFRKTAKGRLMARISEECIGIHEQDTGWKSRLLPFLNVLTGVCDVFCRAFDDVKRGAIPAALTLVLVLISVLSVANIVPGTSSMNAGCTLTVLNGTVDVVAPEVEAGQPGVTGMTLEVGTRVITSEDAQALLTFFDGSTLVIEPGSDIEIEKMAVSTEQSVTIVLKQWLGKTWSRVVKMTDSGSHYEIKTPSAVAVVRGTYFSTEVGGEGETQVHTMEGLVSVFGLGENEDEVLVSPGRQTRVVLGAPPCRPVFADDDDSQNQGDTDYPVMTKNGNAYGLDKENNGNSYGYGYGLYQDDNGTVYDLDKENNGNANGPDNSSGNANGPDSSSGNAYGFNKDDNGNNNENNGNDKDNNGKAKGKDKGSDNSNFTSGLIFAPDDPKPIIDP